MNVSVIWDQEPTTEPSVLQDIRDGVAILTLNRPQRLNAWTPAMGSLYFDLLEQLAKNPEVRAILVHGQGRAFCAGADISGLAGIADLEGKIERDPRPYWYPMSVGKPVVAAIHGACFGVGLQQALCADVRFAADDVRISTAYAQRGLIGEVGITWPLTRIVGAGAAMDFMLSARVIGAEEALRCGLVSRVVPVDSLFDEAFAYCKALADKCSPWSMRMIKEQIYKDLMSHLPEVYDRSEVMLSESFKSRDFKEGVAAFQEKRPVAFPGLDPELGLFDPVPDSARQGPGN